jgi:hypothetical protein
MNTRAGTAASWPSAWKALEAELRSGRGRPALIDAVVPAHKALVDALSQVVDHVVSIGQQIVDAPDVIGLVDRLEARPEGSLLVIDIDVLFAPALGLDVVAFLNRGASLGPLLVLWPGRIAAGRLTYSSPGRADHLDVPARDLLVLRPVATQFPDEVPFNLERVPA